MENGYGWFHDGVLVYYGHDYGLPACRPGIQHVADGQRFDVGVVDGIVGNRREGLPLHSGEHE